MSLGSLLGKLENRELITPYFEAAMLSGNWPESYTVTIDSSPYYGLKDLDGKGGKGGSGDGYFHPSSHPLWSEKKLWYAFNPETRKDAVWQQKTLQGEMTLAMGTALHSVVQAQMQLAGLVREENIEVEYVNREHHCRGRVDFVVDHPSGSTIPVELKTQNSFSFAKQFEIKRSWDCQLSMGLDNLGHDMGILLVLESGWPYKMREYRVPKNVQLLDEVYSKFDNVRDHLEMDVPPPGQCCPPGEAKTCPFRYVEGHNQ